jgi:5'-nucleotidase
MRGRTTAACVAAALVLAACGGDDGGDDTASSDTATEESTTTTAAPETLRILVTNDDGYSSEGIDVLVEGLLTLEDAEITVYAPLEQQSGTSDSSTPGTNEATAEETTLSGHPAVAVDGFPADSVEQGLAAMPEPPHVVVSGINEGQNIGPLTEVSGTVGAARTAARAGIPAFAVSQGISFTGDGPEPDYPTAADLTVAWVTEHRDALVAAEPVDGIAEVTNLNVPTCTTGEQGELIEVPVATEAEVEGLDLGAVDCVTEVTDLPNDVVGFLAGHPVQSELTA